MRIKKDFAPVTITLESESELQKFKEILSEFQRLRASEYRFSLRRCPKTELDHWTEHLLQVLR